MFGIRSSFFCGFSTAAQRGWRWTVRGSAYRFGMLNSDLVSTQRAGRDEPGTVPMMRHLPLRRFTIL
ncbi:hypothetical protein ASC87_08105 [Rhizobacter sp. Root1221]|nr:hypothetical protein ASC87_08105 [Rhizobacter sp. Root1221]